MTAKAKTAKRAGRKAERAKPGRKMIVCYECKKKKPHHARGFCNACYRRVKRRLRGGIPKSKARGHLAPGWWGGEKMFCSVPGCWRGTGWKTPGQIKKNKTGFRCREHRNVRLPVIAEADYEYESAYGRAKARAARVKEVSNHDKQNRRS